MLEERGGEPGTFDIKGVLAQIVDFVRLRALQHGVTAANTHDRLDALASGGHLRPETVAETQAAFDFLMGLRMKRQAGQVLARLEPDNRIDPESLDDGEKKRLKGVFVYLKAVQSSLDHEFKGV